MFNVSDMKGKMFWLENSNVIHHVGEILSNVQILFA